MDRKLILIINGYPGAGKDTFADAVTGELSNLGWHARSTSSIDPIRNMLRKEGISVDKKGPEERKLLSDVKAAMNGYDRYADRMAMNGAVEFCGRPGDRATFIHVREPDAIQFMESICPGNILFTTVFIDRPFESLNLSNDSDRGVEAYEYQFRFLNNGTKERFEQAAEVFAATLNKIQMEMVDG